MVSFCLVWLHETEQTRRYHEGSYQLAKLSEHGGLLIKLCT
uniref:Uncharacterized protein n=1 Tax=Anguilla anguilla TaxID=7936 RepID=A0A0E9PSA5_ANGAN